MAGRVLLAVLLGAAGAIHLAMVPSHTDSSTVEGIGFALAGWVQIGLGLGILASPSRNLLRLVMLASAAFLGVWTISRTWGLPVGDHAGHPHHVAFVDLACVGIEIATAVAAGLLLEHPSWGHTWHGKRLGVAAIVPLSVIALATAALASPGARDHAHGAHTANSANSPHTHDATVAAAGGHVHGVGTASGAGPATAANDLGLSKLENGHQHAFGEVPLDNATQTALSQQLNQTSKLVAKYPTIAAAEAAGDRRGGAVTPGLGTHYIGLGNRNMDDDVIQGTDGPMFPALIYDGTTPDAPLAGFMFTSSKSPDGDEPGGFVGPNDHWHFHTRVCLVYRNGSIEAPFGADRADVSLRDCLAAGGHMTAVTTYMVHVWSVPG